MKAGKLFENFPKKTNLIFNEILQIITTLFVLFKMFAFFDFCYFYKIILSYCRRDFTSNSLQNNEM